MLKGFREEREAPPKGIEGSGFWGNGPQKNFPKPLKNLFPNPKKKFPFPHPVCPFPFIKKKFIS